MEMKEVEKLPYFMQEVIEMYEKGENMDCVLTEMNARINSLEIDHNYSPLFCDELRRKYFYEYSGNNK